MTTTVARKWIPGYEDRYFATYDGHIFRVYRNGKTRELKGYKKRNLRCVKLADGHGHYDEKLFNRVIWETFMGPIPEGYIVARKTSVLTENGMANLRLRTKSQQGRKTGPTSRSKEVVLLDDEGEIIDSWSSARKAAKDLFCSYQTVMDVCNGKVKKPIVNVRWAKATDLYHPRLPEEFQKIRNKKD